MYLHEVIGPHGTSEFCYWVLDNGLGETDKEAINYVEVYELLQHIQRKKQHATPKSPYQWITDTIEDLFAPSNSPEDTDSNSNTDSKPEPSDPDDPWEDPPDQQPEISLKLTREKLVRLCNKVSTENEHVANILL